MKEVTSYICEICGNSYIDKDYALECEAKGKPDAHPIGLIFGNHSPDAFYKEITFAVARSSVSGHSLRDSCWACRDNCYGDNTADGEFCGSGNSNILKEKDVPNKEHPTFKRMVKVLKDKGIPITVWDGIKPIPLEEFLKTSR